MGAFLFTKLNNKKHIKIHILFRRSVVKKIWIVLQTLQPKREIDVVNIFSNVQQCSFLILILGKKAYIREIIKNKFDKAFNLL